MERVGSTCTEILLGPFQANIKPHRINVIGDLGS